MRIIIDQIEYGAVQVSFEESELAAEPVPYDELVAMLLGATQAITDSTLNRFKGTKEERKQFRNFLYDSLDEVFTKFLEKMFPEINPNEFDLSSAAIVKAQDEIIEDAHKNGITYKQALKNYEKKASDYIKQRRLH